MKLQCNTYQVHNQQVKKIFLIKQFLKLTLGFEIKTELMYAPIGWHLCRTGRITPTALCRQHEAGCFSF